MSAHCAFITYCDCSLTDTRKASKNETRKKRLFFKLNRYSLIEKRNKVQSILLQMCDSVRKKNTWTYKETAKEKKNHNSNEVTAVGAADAVVAVAICKSWHVLTWNQSTHETALRFISFFVRCSRDESNISSPNRFIKNLTILFIRFVESPLRPTISRPMNTNKWINNYNFSVIVVAIGIDHRWRYYRSIEWKLKSLHYFSNQLLNPKKYRKKITMQWLIHLFIFFFSFHRWCAAKCIQRQLFHG